jgi:hypothetical protein
MDLYNCSFFEEMDSIVVAIGYAILSNMILNKN